MKNFLISGVNVACFILKAKLLKVTRFAQKIIPAQDVHL